MDICCAIFLDILSREIDGNMLREIKLKYLFCGFAPLREIFLDQEIGRNTLRDIPLK